MPEDRDDEALRLAWSWVARFGEPPPLLEDLDLLRRMLAREDLGRRDNAVAYDDATRLKAWLESAGD